VLTVDCNSRYVNADPEIGTAIAVSEAARNIVCSGGVPSAITNCLNFGNPYNPEVYWQFVGAIKGMSRACLKFETPVTGGNVSFYNQTSIKDIVEPVFPTPTIGMLGIMEDKSLLTSLDFKKEGDLIYLIGTSKNDISSSEYLYDYHKVNLSPPPYFNLDEEYEIHEVVKEVIREKLINSAHDISEGGLFICLFEAARNNKLGFKIYADESIRKDAFLFGEAQGRVVVSVSPENQEAFIEFMALTDVDFSYLGEVTIDEMIVDDISFGSINEADKIYENALGKYMV